MRRVRRVKKISWTKYKRDLARNSIFIGLQSILCLGLGFVVKHFSSDVSGYLSGVLEGMFLGIGVYLAFIFICAVYTLSGFTEGEKFIEVKE